uniref:Uncharacterized protein n=1 Tax=Ditylenchus dipsaci TaxID=166011 RepID=A0A915DPS1_9BILA
MQAGYSSRRRQQVNQSAVGAVQDQDEQCRTCKCEAPSFEAKKLEETIERLETGKNGERRESKEKRLQQGLTKL